MKKVSLLIFLLIGCDYPTDSEADFQDDLFLILYMNDTKDGSLYLVDYPQKDCDRISFFASIKYLTTPPQGCFGPYLYVDLQVRVHYCVPQIRLLIILLIQKMMAVENK